MVRVKNHSNSAAGTAAAASSKSMNSRSSRHSRHYNNTGTTRPTGNNDNRGDCCCCCKNKNDSVAAAAGSVSGRFLLCVVLIMLSLWQSASILSKFIVATIQIPHKQQKKPSWREQPLLSSRGVALEISDYNSRVGSASAASALYKHGNITLIVPINANENENSDNADRKNYNVQDMSAALRYVLDALHLKQQCRAQPELLLVEVGGLKGDFGLTVAAATGCRTIIYEAQEQHAVMMAQSILLPENNDMDEDSVLLSHTVKIRHAAVSPKTWVSFATATAATDTTGSTPSSSSSSSITSSSSIKTTRIATEQLDEEFAEETVLLLKVDVEGGEDDVLRTATNLFLEHRVRHAILEYTPHHFAGRGTDYKTLLPRFLQVTTAGSGSGSSSGGTTATTTTSCYALHQTQPAIYRILPEDVGVFYETLYKDKIQTDLYCCLMCPASSSSSSDPRNGGAGTVADVFYATAPVWTVATHLDE